MRKLTADEMLLKIYDATLVMYYWGTYEPEVVVKHKDVISIIKSLVSEDECIHCQETGKLYLNHYPVPCPACKTKIETDTEITKRMIEEFVKQYDKSACAFYQDLVCWLNQQEISDV